MKRNFSKNNKYLLPICIIAVLLVIALSLLLFVVFGNRNDSSVSKGNVIGGVSEMSVTPNYYGAGHFGGMLHANPSLLLSGLGNSDKMIVNLSVLTGNGVERTFKVSNMMPGDSVEKDYIIKVESSKATYVFFETEIKSGTAGQKLAEILELKVEFDGRVLYDGLLRDMDKLSYPVDGRCDIPCKLTVTMPGGKHIDNSYALLSLTADFIWSMDTEPSSPKPPIDMVGTKLYDSELTGQKTLEGREWQEGDSFTFILEYKYRNGEYQILAEKTVTSANEAIDFTNEITKFLFDKSGLYDFRITEIKGNIKDVKYDSSEKIFQVLIGDNRDDDVLDILSVVGSGVAIAANADGGYDLDFEFTNVYSKTVDPGDDPDNPDNPDDPDDPDDPDNPDVPGPGPGPGDDPDDPGDDPSGDAKAIEVVLPIQNTLDIAPHFEYDGEEFYFVIENVETGEKRIVAVDKDGKGDIKLVYTAEAAGKTFKYKVYAFDDGREGVRYSDKVYEVTVEVFLDPETNTLHTRITVDGEEVREEDVELKFVTGIGHGLRGINTILPWIILLTIVLICEIIWLWYIFHVKKKREKEKNENEGIQNDENGGVKLNSWMTPVPFLWLIVPKWEVIAFIILACITTVMLVVDLALHIKYVHAKEEENPEGEQKEVDLEQ